MKQEIKAQGNQPNAWKSLSRRPQHSHMKNFSKNKLVSNLYSINFDKNIVISIYSVKLNPDILFDSIKKANMIIGSAKRELESFIGNDFIITGRNLFCVQKKINKEEKESFSTKTHFGQEQYEITIRRVKIVEMSKIYSEDYKESLVPLNFLNNLVKKFFATLGYVEIGKSQKYFNPKESKSIPNTKITLYDGYQTSIKMTQGGLFLRVDSMVKIIQTVTVLDQINQIYSRNRHLSKFEKRSAVKEELIGKMVVGNYGNSKHWIIEDIQFDVNFCKTCVAPESKVTIDEYYDKHYAVKIKNLKQPIIRSSNGKNQPQVILIPELLFLTGIPNDFDERKRRQISEHSIIQPEEKLKKIQSLINRFNSNTESCSMKSIQKSLGITIQTESQDIEATLLPPPLLQLGRSESVQQNKVSNFALFNKPIYNSSLPVNILVIIPNDFDFVPIEKIIVSTCLNLEIHQKIKLIKVSFFDSRKAIQIIEKIMITEKNKYEEYDLNWFIIPTSFTKYYCQIKQISLREVNPKVSQVTLLSTLKKKNFQSIVTKILLQISTKIGNVPWAPRIKLPANSKPMMIGIDVGKGKNNSRVIGYCATINQKMSKFNSNYIFQSSKEYKNNIFEIVSKSLEAYFDYNKSLPTEIIILKNGCSQSQLDYKYDEIEEANQVFNEITNKPKLIYIIADKKPKQKFFLNTKNRTSNPSFGTLVNKKVVGKGYQFFLISQNCNRGTAKPVHYKVLYNNTNFEEGVLEELIFAESFNYMNWTGSIRIPAPLQYAEKLVKFVGEHINKPPETEKLNDHLFYI